MYGCDSWTIKTAEHWRIDAFELWCWRRLLRVPWTARRSNQSILKRSVLGVHCKDWCWSWNSNTLATWCKKLTHWKRPWCWGRLRAGGEGDDRGCDGRRHHWLNGHGFGWTPGVGDAIQPSHPLSSPSPPVPNASQHQGLFQWVSSLHQVAKGLAFQLQHQSFQWTPRTGIL